MSALIVEDDELKMGRLHSFLSTELPGRRIEVARSYKSGLRAVIEESRQLVVMDMTLPTFDITPGTDGGRPLRLGGAELLRQMKRRGATYPTVVVTGFDTFGSGRDTATLDQLDAQLLNEFSGFYLGSVYFNATADDWKDQLRALMRRGSGIGDRT
jgi:CheY-like chemotaxis protein